MKPTLGLAATLLLAMCVAPLLTTTPACARGGAAANIMNSPGYQRALEESRKRYRDSASEPYLRSPAVYPRKKWRHRGRRH